MSDQQPSKSLGLETREKVETLARWLLAPAPVDALRERQPAVAEMGTRVTLRDYQVRSVTVGEDAQGEVSVDIEHNGKLYKAQAVSTDIIEASAQAFLDAINRVLSKRQSAHDAAETMRQNVSAQQPAV